MKLYNEDLEPPIASGESAPVAPEPVAAAEAVLEAQAKAKAAEETRFQDLLKRVSNQGPEIGHGWGTSIKIKGGGHGFGQ